MSRYRWKLINHIAKTEYELQRDPQGWKELRLKQYRSETYHGMFQEPSTKEIGFLKNDGFEYLEAAFAAHDVNADVSLLIFKQKADGSYQKIATCKVNFVSRRKTRNVLFLNLEQSSLYQKLLSRDEISVDLQGTRSIGGATITAPTPKTIALPGMEIFQNSEWRWGAASNHDAVSEFTYPGNQFGWFVPTAAVSLSEYEQSLPLSQIEIWDETQNWPFQKATEDEWLQPFLKMIQPAIDYPVTIDYEIDVHGQCIFQQNITGYNADLSYARLNLYKGRQGETPTVVTLFNQTGPLTFPSNFTFDVNAVTGSVTLMPGERLWLAWFVSVEIVNAPVILRMGFNYTDSYIKLSGNTTMAATTTKGYMIHEAFNQVIDAIADKDGMLSSEFYGRTDSDKTTYPSNGAGAWLAISPGAAIRGFDVNGFVSLRDLFKSADAVHNIALGIVNDKVYVGQKSEAYPNTRNLLLPNVKSFTTRTDATRYFNKAVLGFEKWEAEFKGGRDDPQTRHEYSTIINSINGQYEKLSKIIASTYALEATRRRSKVTYASEDWRFDNDNFWLALNDDYTMELLADAFASPSGMVNAATAYNLRLTPKRMLLAHFNVLVAALQTIGGDITFVNAQGNAELQLTKTDIGNQEDYNGQPLAESASLAHNDADVANAQPLFLPELYELEYPLTEAMQDDLNENPYGFVEFYENDGAHYFGYILEADTLLDTGLTTFKLIRKKI